MTRNRPTNLHLSDKLDIIDARLDDVEKVLIKQEEILIKQEENLKEHMKRTALLETKADSHDKFYYGALGIIGFITFAGIVAGIFAAIK